MLGETPFQTAGPYVHIGCVPNCSGVQGVYSHDLGAEMIGAKTQGEPITVGGAIFDGAGVPLTDALIEFWQANAAGTYADDPHFAGFGRRACDYETGEWVLETIKPGGVSQNGEVMAPHILVWIVARGINNGLLTRFYFPDEDNTLDPILTRIGPTRDRTLIAEQTGPSDYRFDIRLQGDGETVFFDV